MLSSVYSRVVPAGTLPVIPGPFTPSVPKEVLVLLLPHDARENRNTARIAVLKVSLNNQIPSYRFNYSSGQCESNAKPPESQEPIGLSSNFDDGRTSETVDYADLFPSRQHDITREP